MLLNACSVASSLPACQPLSEPAPQQLRLLLAASSKPRFLLVIACPAMRRDGRVAASPRSHSTSPVVVSCANELGFDFNRRTTTETPALGHVLLVGLEGVGGARPGPSSSSKSGSGSGSGRSLCSIPTSIKIKTKSEVSLAHCGQTGLVRGEHVWCRGSDQGPAAREGQSRSDRLCYRQAVGRRFLLLLLLLSFLLLKQELLFMGGQGSPSLGVASQQQEGGVASPAPPLGAAADAAVVVVVLLLLLLLLLYGQLLLRIAYFSFAPCRPREVSNSTCSNDPTSSSSSSRASWEAVKVAVPSKGPKKEGGGKTKGGEEMTEDDRKVKENIELLVERTCDSDLSIVALALETLSRELKAATSSMTSVPKPLKFLRPHLDRLVDRYKELESGSNLKRDFAMVLSVTCTTSGDARRLSLHFCLEAQCKDVTSWGYEFLRNLSGQIASAFAEAQQQEALPAAGADAEQEGVSVDASAASAAAGGHAASAGREGAAEEESSEAKAGERGAAAVVNGVAPAEAPKPSKGLASVEVVLPRVEQLLQLVEEIVPFYMQHNAEVDAIDLLTEVERPQSLLSLLDANNYQRVVAYLLSLSNYAANFDESLKVQNVAFEALMQQQQHCDALRVAMRVGDRALIDRVVKDCKDPLVLQQLALLLCRQRIDVEFEDEKLQRLVSGSKTSVLFRLLAKELDVLDPKEPEDVFKRHLEDPHGRRARLAGIESAHQNLASSFVNAFVNCGFGTDKLMTVEGNAWLYKNKDRGLLSTTASLGALCLWNVDEALQQLDKHQYSNDVNIKAGALLGFGVSSCNVRHECDAALALLKDHLEATEVTAETPLLKCAAVIGLGCAYAGSCREDVLELLTLAILDGSLPLECSAFASLSLGLCFIGSASADAAEAILTALMDRCSAAKAIDCPLGHFLSVGLGLVFLGTRDAADAALCAVAALPHAAFSATATRIIEGLAAAGSGDVLKVQRMLGVCAEPRPEGYWAKKQRELMSEQQTPEGTTDAAAAADPAAAAATATEGSAAGIPASATEAAAGATAPAAAGAAQQTNPSSTASSGDDDDDGQDDMDRSVAVLNIALIAFAEETGAEMALRLYDHILQYADAHMKRAVPLAVALQHPSNPKPQLIDLLSKLSHDADPDTALNAIFAMGVLGAGTNHSRIASLLRQLASYYGKDPSALFVVRLSQGLLYLGKGLLQLGALHSDRQVICRVALGSLAIIIYAGLLMRHTVLGKFHFLLYFLFPAVQPRWLVTVAEHVEGAAAEESSASEARAEGAATQETKSEAAGGEGTAMETDGVASSAKVAEAIEGEEDLRLLPVPVRVGEAVDVVAQVGRQPKTITGFQTHASPVLLSFSERAELATDEYLPVARVLEGIVLLRKNPDYQPPKAP
ncbi:hypothetical protein Esti_000813 [Eimeria stiedai]